MNASTSILLDARAEALFASNVQPSDRPDPAQIHAAIVASIRAHGSRGCAALVAQEFGDHPETAVNRMIWARATVTQLGTRPLFQTSADFRPTPQRQRDHAGIHDQGCRADPLDQLLNRIDEAA